MKTIKKPRNLLLNKKSLREKIKKSSDKKSLYFLKIRLQLEVSQQCLADKLGIQQSEVAAWENGRRLPSIKTIKKYVTFCVSKGIRVSEKSLMTMRLNFLCEKIKQK